MGYIYSAGWASQSHAFAQISVPFFRKSFGFSSMPLESLLLARALFGGVVAKVFRDFIDQECDRAWSRYGRSCGAFLRQGVVGEVVGGGEGRA